MTPAHRPTLNQISTPRIFPSDRLLLQYVAFAVIVTVGGCNRKPELIEPWVSFKEVSDAKKREMEEFLQSHGSFVWMYEATVTAETNVDYLPKHTHIGKIKFSYGVTPRTTTNGAYLDEFTAHYVYLRNEATWQYTGSAQSKKSDPIGTKKRLLEFDQVRRAFSKYN